MMRAVAIWAVVVSSLALMVVVVRCDDGMAVCQQTHSFDVCADALF